jgi:hypothetical protein
LENAQPSFLDSAEQRYEKLKKSVQLFSVIQLGVATFRYCAAKKAFIADTYNFYLFPRNYGLDSLNTLQTSAVEFLCKYQFDFNKVSNSRRREEDINRICLKKNPKFT